MKIENNTKFPIWCSGPKYFEWHFWDFICCLSFLYMFDILGGKIGIGMLIGIVIFLMASKVKVKVYLRRLSDEEIQRF